MSKLFATFPLFALIACTLIVSGAAAESNPGLDFMDSTAIQKKLGGAPIRLMGPGGQKDVRRLPLRIEFDTDKDTIRAAAQRQIDALGNALKRIIEDHPDAAFVIEGHTDARGSQAHNDDLSLRRAHSVARVLVERFQIPRDHLAIQGYGERRTIAGGTSAADLQLDRRVEVLRHEVGELANLPGVQVITTARAPDRPAAPAPAPAPARAVANGVSLEAAVFYEDAESRPRKLRENTALRSGDGYRVYFRPQKNQYLYVVQQDATKQLFALFPNPEYGHAANAVEAGREYWVPQDKWLELDDSRGSETIYFIASSKPRGDIEELLRRASDPQAETESAYEIKSMGEILTMGVKARPRAGRPVAVRAAAAGAPMEINVDALVGDGVDLIHTVTFRHE